MTNLNYIDFQSKARYYTFGELNENTRYLFIAFHGYGQMANYFIRNFQGLGDEYFIVVPEGLHHFYLEGMTGRVGASWMTKEDREVDIENQSAYLNKIISQFGELKKQNVKLCIFGFSQGVATALRWVVRNKINSDFFFSWAGSLPNDLPPTLVESVMKESKMFIILGDTDPYFTTKARGAMNSLIESYNLRVEKIRYEGDHRIFPEILNKIALQKLT